MAGLMKQKAPSASYIPDGIRQRYNARFELMMINYTKNATNFKPVRKFIVAEANIRRWRQQKQTLLNVNST
jgi:hypothetical protein